jgi:LuxR family maltose regulon positive regulatory protein
MGELRALRWSDVDFAKRLVHVRRSYTGGAFGAPKSQRVRSVPMSDPVARVLDGLSRRDAGTRADDLVFSPGIRRSVPPRHRAQELAGGSTWANRVPRVGSALAARERSLVLVLDDLHAVANPSCLDVLAMLVGYVPAGSQIAIATSEAPALPLARWRAHGRVDEIGVTDLRLDDHEAELLLQAAGVALDANELSELTERTEGWPAGLYLAGLSMLAGAPNSTNAASFTGDDRFVSEYFRLELLSRLPAAEAQFLKRTSVLHRMCGGLCDAVLQTTQSADMLDALERTNGFVVPLDRRGE